VQQAKFGPAYRARAVVYRGRTSIGRVQEASIPQGVHWDLFLGPAPYRAFTMNRFHYGWHYFWDTSTTEVGNNGVHAIDVVRWALGKNVHPVKIHCTGGLFKDGSEQETPHYQNASFEYADGTLVELDVTTLPSPSFGGVQGGEFFYTPQGYVTSANKWTTVAGEFTPRTAPDLPSGVSLRVVNASFPAIAYKPGPPIPDVEVPERSHFENFIDCVRSRKRENQNCEILEGHLSTSLCHLANIAFRTGRKLTFDPATETFPGDKEANQYLTRKYREGFVVPDKV
jgi:predicted dehydrogenase